MSDQCSYRGYAHVLQLCLERESVRKDKDYKRSDAIRDELAAEGVRLDDKSHTFFTKDGLEGHYRLSEGVGFHEVQMCCLDREEARRDKDYKAGDDIRNYLTELGVQVTDKTHTFATSDGQEGSYILGKSGGGNTNHGPADHRPAAGGYQPPPQARDRYAPAPPPPTRAPHGYEPARATYGASGCRAQPYAPPRHYPPPPPPADGAYDRGYGRAARADASNGQSHGWEAALRSGAWPAPPPPSAAPSRPAPAPRPAARPASRAAGGCGWPAPPPPSAPSAWLAPAAPVPAAAWGGGGGGSGGAEGGAGSGIEVSFKNYLAALLLALEREEARKDKAYKEADRLRNELKDLGVEVHDASHTFTFNESGVKGSYDLKAGLSAQALQMVALEREEVRKGKDYAESDRLRDWLLEQGVTVDDKAHSFRTSLGIVGSFDLRTWTPVDASSGHSSGGEGWSSGGGDYGEAGSKRRRY